MKFTYKRREFLSPVETHFNSFITAIVESSDNGTYTMGSYTITMADCKRILQFEFPLANGYLRRDSLRKAELLAETFNQFRNALKTEADLINQHKKGKKNAARSRGKSQKRSS